ncbi:hypothetical protein NP233_g7364 [Leucocoprinus birnbaumii]|uniref:Nephrocystin 3-like N-terminal domain-containing protein n=1 Tax=Leucocoprinus birnbaumii TaxID=56174 RepID=A0AAD5VPF1_9AGAR|nr:hypothetical protein NP233_g7364 [Leucocoprinus birnbaumii]
MSPRNGISFTKLKRFFGKSKQGPVAATKSGSASLAAPSSESAQQPVFPTQISVPTGSEQLLATAPLSDPSLQAPAPGLPVTASAQHFSSVSSPNPSAVSHEINLNHDPQGLHSGNLTPSPSIQILPSSTTSPPAESYRSVGPQLASSLLQAPPLTSTAFVPHASPSNPTTPNIPERGMFDQAQGLVFNNSHFAVNNNSSNPHYYNASPTVGYGLKELLDHSMPDAFHDSAARDPPPKCHLGTRKEYIAKVTDWALGNTDLEKRVLWLHGPFGIGKTAVAQTSAEALRASGKLLGTLFFSRSSANRNNPLQVFTSFAYHIATQCEAFAAIIDKRIRNDPAITRKSLATQFQELLVIPLSQIDPTRKNLSGRVVIIDGLDECRGVSEQREIIKIIAASARNCTTPFRWFITSRPEEHIIHTMTSPSVSPIVSCIELPVSREIDHEILLYLTDEFEKIREQSGLLEEDWPSEDALAHIVERADGLWIYVSTITRFVSDNNSFGPEHQLQLVLKFTPNRGEDGTINPLAEMDILYTLIMEQVPTTIRTTLRKILLLHSMDVSYYDSLCIATILGLSVEQFRRCCASIQSVMKLTNSNRSDIHISTMKLYFYHASFLEFLTNPERSRDLCIHGAFLTGIREPLLESLHFAYSRTQGRTFITRSLHEMTILLPDPSEFVFPSGRVLPENIKASDHHVFALCTFWRLYCLPGHPIDAPTAKSISQLPFRKLFSFLPHDINTVISYEHLQIMMQNLPTEFQNRLVRIVKCPTPGCTSTRDVVILGEGENELIAPSGGDCLLWVNTQMLEEAGSVVEVAKHTVGMIFTGGVDTTLAVIRTFVLAVLLEPEAQQSVQQEFNNSFPLKNE